MTDTATRESVVAELVAESATAQEQPNAAAAAVQSEPEVIEDEPAAEAEPSDTPIPEGGQPSDPDAPDDPASEGEDEAPAPETASEAPHFWPAEMKARFAELPVDLQVYVLEAEKAGSKAVTQRLEEASLSKKEAESERQVFAQLNAKIAAAALKAEGAFKDRWAGMTPDRWLELSQKEPETYVKYRAQFDAEQLVIQQAQSAKEQASAVEREQWRTEQVEALKTLAPELVDPVKGTERLTALGDYLIKQHGVAEQDLPNIGAVEMSIALKAMRFDELQALKPTPKPKPQAGVRPSAAPPATPTKERAIQQAKNRFAQTCSREDAVALMLLEES